MLILKIHCPYFLIFELLINSMFHLPLYYEWDENKAKSNYQKHGIYFADAVSIFNDMKNHKIFN